MKTVIAISHSGNKGKTETVREFANLLLLNYPSARIIFPISFSVPQNGDFRLILEINGKTIGIESQGDPNTNLDGRLTDLAVNFNCDIIICATRTKGETVHAVFNLVNMRNFQSIWTSTYALANPAFFQIVNQLKAKHILELIQSLSLL